MSFVAFGCWESRCGGAMADPPPLVDLGDDAGQSSSNLSLSGNSGAPRTCAVASSTTTHLTTLGDTQDSAVESRNHNASIGASALPVGASNLVGGFSHVLLMWACPRCV